MTAVPAPSPAVRTSLLRQVAYGAGQIAGQIFRDTPSLLLLFFMTNVLGVQPAIAGAAIFFPKLVWGVLCDVGVGLTSDRLANRFPRRAWLLLGAVGAPLAMVLLFHVPEGSTALRTAYVAGAFSLYMLVFSAFSVPYLAIGAEMASTSHERTVLMAWRLVFTAVGVLIAGAIAPAFVQSRGGDQPAFEQMALLLAGICPVALLIAYLGSKRSSAVPERAGTNFSWAEAWKALANRRFSVLLGATLLQLVGSGMGYASMLYFLTYNMGREDALTQIGILVLIMSASIIGAQPLWVALSKRLGKKRVYLISAVGYALAFGAWGLLGQAGMPVAYGLAVLVGVFNSGWALMGFSMLSDIAAGEHDGEGGRAGFYSAVWIAADKIGFALGGTLLVGLALSGFGFDAQRAVTGAPQPASALTGIAVAFAFAPASLNLIAAAIYARFGRHD